MLDSLERHTPQVLGFIQERLPTSDSGWPDKSDL